MSDFLALILNSYIDWIKGLGFFMSEFLALILNSYIDWIKGLGFYVRIPSFDLKFLH